MFELNNLFKYVSVINETNNELTLQAKGEPDKVVGETWFILDKYNFKKVTLVGEDNATHTFEKNKQSLISMVNDWKRALERAYSYQTFEQFYKALEQLPVCDFANEKTSLAKAIEFSKKFMTIMSKSEYLRLDYQQQEMVSQLLKQKGACKYDQAAEKFKPKKEENIHSMVTSSGNVYFPLSAMSQMIDTSNETFRIAMSKMNDGGKESWCMEWVNSQKPQEKSLEN